MKINNLLCLNSRDWIIAESESQLNQYKEIIISEKLQNNVKADNIVKEKYNYLQNGWQFK